MHCSRSPTPTPGDTKIRAASLKDAASSFPPIELYRGERGFVLLMGEKRATEPEHGLTMSEEKAKLIAVPLPLSLSRPEPRLTWATATAVFFLPKV